ncbi:MAG TPA: hypothetical protein VN736_29440 [Candidatus Limnocylindrales bacterium]|nr:hypothetical protein [Candidatus Limnocylindrales bacterium]
MPDSQSLICVRRKPTRKRTGSFTAEQKRRIIFLFDQTNGDADYAAERCGVVGVQRADVLAIVLADTRRKQPQGSPTLQLTAKAAVA